MLPVRSALIALALLVISSGMAAAGYPEKPIEIVVPNPPGGSSDLLGRIIAKALEKTWKVPVRIVNTPGGAGFVAVQDVMRAKPDGYTLLIDGRTVSSLLGLLNKDLPFKITDRTFVTYMVRIPLMLGVPSDSPWKTLDDAIAAIRTKPDSISYTAPGGTYIAMSKLFRTAGTTLAHARSVVTKGGSEAAIQLAGGHVMLGAASPTSFKTFIEGGQIRALAVFDKERAKIFPNVPSTAELGHPELATTEWYGISGPPGLPEEIRRKWHDTIQILLADPSVAEAIARLAIIPYPTEYGALERDVKEEIKIVDQMVNGN